MNISRHSLSLRHDASVDGIFRTHLPLRRVAFALSMQIAIYFVGVGDVARAEAENYSSSVPVVVSACRPTAGLAAFGRDPKISFEMRKGSQFARMAVLHMIAGNTARAFEQFDHAIDLNPVNPHFYLGRGMARLRNDELSRAVEDFDRAIALDRTSSVAFFGRGQVYDRMSEYGRAIEDLNEAVNLLPANAAAYTIRGSVYTGMREYERAIEDIGHAIKLDPTCSIGYLYRGIAHELKGEQDRAMADYTRAIELNPNPTSADGLTWRAHIFRKNATTAVPFRILPRRSNSIPGMLAD